ncbi:MAG: hypothetical protein Q3998_06440 [Porphyromonas sp.]|nr:hypothetical protein [Porphyromonas sp.]
MSSTLFVFNPGYEESLLPHLSGGYTPPKQVQKMRDDLALLPYYMGARSGDALFSFSPERWQQTQMPLCGTAVAELLPKREKSYRLVPWGWSPDLHNLPYSIEHFPTIEEMRLWGSRESSYALLDALLMSHPDRFRLPRECFKVVRNKQELDKQLKENHPKVIKSPYSSSGRGVFFLDKAVDTNDYLYNSLMGLLKKQGELYIEPYLKKEKDLAFEFYCSNEKSEKFLFLGYSEFITEKGRYIGNKVSKSLTADKADETTEIIRKALHSVPALSTYNGFLGVDAMIYRDLNNEPQLHPCVELNIRPTMGHISLFLSDLCNSGTYKILYFPKEGEALKYAISAQKSAIVEGGKLLRGTISLLPVDQKTQFLAVLSASDFQ